MSKLFRRFSSIISATVGSAWAFIIAFATIVVWAISGPIFGFSDTWQLVINTSTTIVTFLMVFLIQNTQNRDAKAIHLKLDELLRAAEGARNSIIDLEDVPDEELEKLRASFQKLREDYEPLISDDLEVVEAELHARKHTPNRKQASRARSQANKSE